MSGQYTIKYNKCIKEYTYYIQCALESELIVESDEPDTSGRYNIILSWFYDKSCDDMGIMNKRTKVRPSVIKTLETIECTEILKQF